VVSNREFWMAGASPDHSGRCWRPGGPLDSSFVAANPLRSINSGTWMGEGFSQLFLKPGALGDSEPP